MYFGSSEKPFSLFLAFLSGVGMGHGIDHRFSSLKDSDFAPEGFYEFVAARFAGHYPDGGGTRGWWTFVRENSKSDDEAFDLYIRLLEEFDRANRGKETYGCSLEEGSASLELGCAPDGSGDYLVSLTVRVEGFSGHADGHVAGADWIAFVKAIRNLEETRREKRDSPRYVPGSLSSGFTRLILEAIWGFRGCFDINAVERRISLSSSCASHLSLIPRSCPRSRAVSHSRDERVRRRSSI